MSATVSAERVGWQRGMSVLRDRVRELRPAFVPADPGVADGLPAGRAGAVRPDLGQDSAVGGGTGF
jgi:hypothetical protein